jgi:predicted dehydrogenase
MALSNNKNVLCEKPLGMNKKEAEEIYSMAKREKKILKTGFNHRHHPAIHLAKKLAESNEIGKVYFIRCIYGHGGRPGYEKEWRASRDLCGGGELLDQGVHAVDLFRWFLGEFNEAYGQINTFYWNMEVEDNAFAMFKTKSGQVAVMHTSWTQWKNKFLFEVFGENGYIIVDGLGGSYGTETLKIGKRKIENENLKSYLGGPPDEKIIKYPGPDTSWVEEWKEFVSAIKENREPLGSGYDGLMANKMIEAVYRSAKLNKPVKISE